jgi:hypothetical protein
VFGLLYSRPSQRTRQGTEATRVADAATAAKRERATTICALVAPTGPGPDLAGDRITRGVPLDQARAAILDRLAARDERVRTERHLVVNEGARFDGSPGADYTSERQQSIRHSSAPAFPCRDRTPRQAM